MTKSELKMEAMALTDILYDALGRMNRLQNDLDIAEDAIDDLRAVKSYILSKVDKLK